MFAAFSFQNFGWCIFRPTQIRYTPLLTIRQIRYTTRGFTASIWTFGLSARPLTCSSRGARSPLAWIPPAARSAQKLSITQPNHHIKQK